MMATWVYCKNILKTFAVKDSDFNLVHTVVDGWISYDYPNHIMFEYNGSYYIADELDSELTGFSSNVYVNLLSGRRLRLDYDGTEWVWYDRKKDQQWFKKGNSITFGNYYADKSDGFLKPYNIKGGSEDIDNNDIRFFHYGADVYKSNSKLGSYVWQGNGSRDTIIVGKRKYKHVVESSDIFVIESVEIVEESTNNWRYNYEGKDYFYTGELPLGNFTMTNSEQEELNMIYVELVTVVRNDILHYDGGAQIVD